MLKDFLGSIHKAIIIVLCLIVVFVIATFFERSTSSSLTQSLFYHSWWLWLLITVGSVMTIYQVFITRKFSKNRIYSMMLHGSFIFIIVGALVTHFTSQEGFVVVREGESTNIIINERQQPIDTLPFSIILNDFSIERHSGSGAPANYISDITIVQNKVDYPYKIAMNKVVDFDGYRFYQSSFDKDEKGTILMVNKDAIGTFITYTGYIFLFMGLGFSFVAPNSHLRQLLRKLLIASFLFLPMISHATLTDADIDQIALIPVQAANGRIEPFSTFSQQVIQKLSGNRDYRDHPNEEIIIEMLAGNKRWQHEPIIEVENSEIRKQLSLPGEYCSFIQFFSPQRGYLLKEKMTEIYAKSPDQQNRFEKDLIALDEKVNIIYQLYAQQLPALIPMDGEVAQWTSLAHTTKQVQQPLKESFYNLLKAVNNRNSKQIATYIKEFTNQQELATVAENRISHNRLRVETLYNRFNFPFLTAIILITMGIMGIATFLLKIKKESATAPLFESIIGWGVLISIILLTLNIILRWYAAGRVPISNSYETIMLIAYLLCWVAWGARRLSIIILASISFIAGCFLMIAHVGGTNPQITPLVPVLNSHWLLFHVATIAVSYGLFALSAILGLVYMLLKIASPQKEDIEKVANKITILNELSQLIGVSFLTIGIFLGAIWANVSWGRYWAWDPKETWALITLLVYVINSHIYLSKRLYSPFIINSLSIYSIAFVIMTFFGVNLFFGGMHAYGGVHSFPWEITLLIFSFISLLNIIAYRRINTVKNEN